MEIKLPKSLADVEDGFELLDPGTYDFRVAKIEQKTGKTSGKAYLNVELECFDEDYLGRRVFDILSLGDSSLWRLKAFAVACGVDIEFEFDTDDFIGEECNATIDIEKDDNEEYPDKNRVKKYN